VAVVSATRFKAQCLELMDRVAERRATYVITKRGKAVAKLVPADPPKRRSVFGCMAGRMDFAGELDQPAWSAEEWRRFERERSEQAEAWERAWQSRGAISRSRTAGRPPNLPKKGASKASRARKARR
jgi:prevent-host-death family protein